MALRENGVQRRPFRFRFGLPGGAEIIPCTLVFQPEPGFVQDGGDDDRSAKSGCAHGTSREIWPKRKVMCCFLALDQFGVFQVRGGPSRQQLRVWCLSHQLWPESRSAPTLVSSCGGHGKTCAQALQAARCVLEEWSGMASDEKYGVDGAKLRDRLGFTPRVQRLGYWYGRNRYRLVRRRGGSGSRIVEERAVVTREYSRRSGAGGVGGRENPSSTFGYLDFKRPQSGRYSSLGHGDLV